MPRRRFNILSVLSLILLAGTAALWVRSQYVADSATLFIPYMGYQLGTQEGQLRMMVDWEDRQIWKLFETHKGFTHKTNNPTSPSRRDRAMGNWAGIRHHIHVGGFRFFWCVPGSYYKSGGYGTIVNRTTTIEIAVPFWFLSLIFAFAPARWRILRRRDRRDAAAGLCPTCGYDLRATPDRCPECGAAFKAADPAGVKSSGGRIGDLPG